MPSPALQLLNWEKIWLNPESDTHCLGRNHWWTEESPGVFIAKVDSLVSLCCEIIEDIADDLTEDLICLGFRS